MPGASDPPARILDDAMPSDALILAIDQGTTNSKALLVAADGVVVAQASRPVAIDYPQAGWVEQDAQDIWRSVLACIDEVMDASAGASIAGIGISNQRETAVAWDRATGAPMGPAVSWQCRRSGRLVDDIRAAGHAAAITARSGLPLDPGFTAGKWRWLIDHAQDGVAHAASGELCLGTVDTWLAWNLSGGRAHVTDVTNASRTQLLNLDTVAWDPWLAEVFGLPLAALPRIEPSAHQITETVAQGRLPAGIPVASLVGDSHAALFGHAAFGDGAIKATYGTGSSLMMPTRTRLPAVGGLASTVAWGATRTVFALEGNIYVTGAAVQWVADFAGLAGPERVAELAAAVDDTDGVYLVPAFVGLGAPYWDDRARGLVSGLTRGSRLEQLARAAIDAVAYQVRDVFDQMQSASDGDLRLLLADGGVTRNDQLMQFQADILDVPVRRNRTAELSAMGAAYLAGLATGVWTSLEEIEALPRAVDRFEPAMAAAERSRRYDGWQEAISRATLRP
jgi:glycerol kinase